MYCVYELYTHMYISNPPSSPKDNTARCGLSIPPLSAKTALPPFTAMGRCHPQIPVLLAETSSQAPQHHGQHTRWGLPLSLSISKYIYLYIYTYIYVVLGNYVRVCFYSFLSTHLFVVVFTCPSMCDLVRGAVCWLNLICRGATCFVFLL